MSELAQALMLGLPSSGKTSFLAAFYHVVEAAQIPGTLKLVRYPPVREYLERIRGDWVALERQSRTQSTTVEENVIELSSPTGQTFNLFFPDVAGESCRVLVEDRNCEAMLWALIKESDRLLLFVHPDHLVNSPTIAEVSALASALNVSSEDETTASLNHAEEMEVIDAAEQMQGEIAKKVVTPWDAEMISTQVKLVDLLQVAGEIHSGFKRVCVVISAWDRVRAQGLGPEEWLKTRLPFLWQYLTSNRYKTEYRVFGVSAVGGDVEADRNVLQKKSPSERIDVVGIDAGADSKDITLPIQWLLG